MRRRMLRSSPDRSAGGTWRDNKGAGSGTVPALSGLATQQLAGARCPHLSGEPSRLELRYVMAERREPIVAAALVRRICARRGISLFDEAVRKKAADRAIERAGEE